MGHSVVVNGRQLIEDRFCISICSVHGFSVKGVLQIMSSHILNKSVEFSNCPGCALQTKTRYFFLLQDTLYIRSRQDLNVP